MGGTYGDVPIGVLGVGRMGLSIAGRLSATGRRVRVFDVSEDRRAAAHERGLGVMRSQQGLAAGSEILVTALPGPAECDAARGTLGFCIGGAPEAIERVSAVLGVLGPADRACGST